MLKTFHPSLAETFTPGSPIIRSAPCTPYSSEISTVKIVWGKGYSVEGKNTFYPETGSPTITREVYYANSRCKNSPSAKALPPPPYHWVLLSRKQTKLRSTSSSEDVSFVSVETSEQCSEDGSLASDVSYSNNESLVSSVEYEIESEASDVQYIESKSDEDEYSEDGFLVIGEERTENLSIAK